MNTRLLLLLALLLAAPLARAAAIQVGPVEAELVAERTALVVGQTNWVALRLKPDPQWHVYWRNPGDSGIPTKLEWQLPKGIEAGEIVWPYPQIRSEEHTSELQSLMRISYAVFCLNKKTNITKKHTIYISRRIH